ncbi:hypothetical protein M8J77_014537 [Diaphorina citri]|nr:hypothetical protein M8J77_014537 [Diaphorina citri]
MFLLGCTYTPPSSSVHVYLEHCQVVEELRLRFPLAHLVLLGDYNLTTAVWSTLDEVGMVVECSSSDAPAFRVCESFNGLGLTQVNSLPNNHGNFLDLLFTDIPDIVTHVAIDNLLQNNFHHNAFCFDIPLNNSVEFVSDDIVIYDYSKCNLQELKLFLGRVNWSSVFSHVDINENVAAFNEILLTGISLFTPEKLIRPSNFPRWFSYDLKRLTFEKKKAHAQFKRTGLDSDYRNFSTLRAQCKFFSDQCYKAYLERTNQHLKSNPRYFWKFSEESRKVSGFPKSMFFNDITCSSLQETADLFGQYFSDVYRDSDQPIPEYSYSDRIDFNTCRFSEDDVSRGLSSLKCKFSSGPDRIPSFILQRCSSVLSNPLSFLFNKSLSSGIFPVEWKKSFVIPIFKSGDRCNISNYRGVCIQSCVLKLLDKLIAEKLAFASRSFISDEQHGFVSRRSTVTNLLCYQHDILQSFKSANAVHSIYTDVAKAFDRVNVSFLIAKLRSYGIGESFLTWLSDYLSGRSQLVRVGSCVSSPINVLSGVGQGSHSGPLLFSLFFNDLPQLIQNSSILLFADDVKIYKSISSVQDCALLQADLERFSEWLSTNGLQLSVHKCAVMEFCRSRSPPVFNYRIDSETLPLVNQIKDLGIYLDKTLSFSSHVDKVSLSCHRVLGYVFRNSKGLSSEAFCTLFKALVRSLLEYGSIVWSPHYEVQAHALERVQKRFLWYHRFRFGQDAAVVPLSVRREHHDIRFFDKLVRGEVDCSKLIELLTLDCSRHVRHCKTFYIEKCDTNYQFYAPINRMMRAANEM